MTTMLKHIPTGDLYIYTDVLFKRGDMEIVEAPIIVPVTEPSIKIEKASKPNKVAAAPAAVVNPFDDK